MFVSINSWCPVWGVLGVMLCPSIRVQEKDEKIRSVEESLKSALQKELSRVKAIEVCACLTQNNVCHTSLKFLQFVRFS